MTVTVGLVCDEPIVCRGLSGVLESGNDFRFVSLEGEPSELIENLASERIDVLLVDFTSRVSIPFLATLRKRYPECRILLWTRDVSVQVAHSVYELGLRGIVRKSLQPDLLVRCLRVVAEGELWYERSVMQALQESKTVKLTPRETQLLTLVGQGLTNKEIATELSLTEGTVKFYMSRLFKKMGVGDRFELALFGLKTLFQDSGGTEDSKPPTVATLGMNFPRSIVLDPHLVKSA